MRYEENHLSNRLCYARWISVFALLGLFGCGDSGPQTIPVSGKITFAGGPCPKPGSIVFGPAEAPEGTITRSGTAKFDEDGVFEVTSFEEGDGLLPGKYIAVVECWTQPPVEPQDYEKFNLVPKDYRPEVEIPEDESSVEITLDVPTKK